MVEDEAPLCLSRLYQLTEEYNAVFHYVCQIITADIRTWSMPNQQALQSSTIYLSFICQGDQGIVLPPSLEVRTLRVFNGSVTKLLKDLLKDLNWKQEPYRKGKKLTE